MQITAMGTRKFTKRLYLFFSLLIVTTITYGVNVESVKVIDVNELQLVGSKVWYFEDASGYLSIDDMVKKSKNSDFIQQTTDVFNRPATNSSFWFRLTVENKTIEDLWLEVGSTYCWYIDFYAPDTLGNYSEAIKTGTMRPYENKLWDINLFWLPLNKSGESEIKTYYLRIKGGSTFELPLQVGTIRSLSKNKDLNDYFTAGFLGLILIMFLYNLFIYISTKDHIYLYYLGYLFMMMISMPYANNYPFIQHLELGFIDKQWWNNMFLFWHPIVYFFVGEFCIRYLNLAKNAIQFKHIIRVLMIVIAGVFPILTLFGQAFVDLVNVFQVLVLLLYFSCLVAGYVLVFKKIKQAYFYVIGWTLMISFTFIFFAVINGFFPFNPITRNALYIGVALEVWMFSLALGNRLNLLRMEMGEVQDNNIKLISNQNIILEQRVNERTRAMERSNDELLNKNASLKQATDLLNAKSAQLKAINDSKDKLFAIVSHDLQSPLITLRNIMQMADNQILDADGYTQLSAKIKDDVEHIHFSMNNLLHWSVTQMQGVKINSEHLKLYPIVKEHEFFFKALAQAKQISLSNLVDEKFALYADPNVIRLILRNLINNALKFTRKNGQVIIEASIKDNYAVISVKDNGVGMDSKMAKELLTSITRESVSGTQGEKGTGLGLKLCKEYLEKCGGELSVESEIGKGSVFYVAIPIIS